MPNETFLSDPLSQTLCERARRDAGHDAPALGVVLALDDLEPVPACIGGVVGHIDVGKHVADAKTRRLGDSSAHDSSCQREQDVTLLKPREAGEPEQGLDVPTPQREQKLGWLSSKRAECLQSPAEGSGLPEGRGVTVSTVAILDGAPDVSDAPHGRPHEKEFHRKSVEEFLGHREPLIRCIVCEKPSDDRSP
jgi:hypothetical protein